MPAFGLREDPDVILVGELRDLETIRLALTAAETGHLVFGTLHTSGGKTIDRIVDVFPAGKGNGAFHAVRIGVR
jgi:twitching motility protein PilT